jgi:hypothetical protein
MAPAVPIWMRLGATVLEWPPCCRECVQFLLLCSSLHGTPVCLVPCVIMQIHMHADLPSCLCV